jgi:hypothetical protein
MPKQMGDLSPEERQEFEDRDIAGERGGDTGNAAYIDDGPDAEKGDARRDKPVHSGPTRRGTSKGGDKRSGSDSNSS